VLLIYTAFCVSFRDDSQITYQDFFPLAKLCHLQICIKFPHRCYTDPFINGMRTTSKRIYMYTFHHLRCQAVNVKFVSKVRVHITPKKFENGVFGILKTHQMFSFEFHSTPKNLKTRQSPCILAVYVWGRLGRGNDMIIVTSFFFFSKSPVFKMFSIHTKTQSWRFQILRFEERFRKAPIRCRDGLVWMVGLTVEIDWTAVSNFSGVVWTGLRYLNVWIESSNWHVES